MANGKLFCVRILNSSLLTINHYFLIYIFLKRLKQNKTNKLSNPLDLKQSFNENSNWLKTHPNGETITKNKQKIPVITAMYRDFADLSRHVGYTFSISIFSLSLDTSPPPPSYSIPPHFHPAINLFYFTAKNFLSKHLVSVFMTKNIRVKYTSQEQ